MEEKSVHPKMDIIIETEKERDTPLSETNGNVDIIIKNGTEKDISIPSTNGYDMIDARPIDKDQIISALQNERNVLKDEVSELKSELSESRGNVLNLEAKIYMLEGVGKLRKGAIVRLERMLENLNNKIKFMREQAIVLNDYRKQQEDANELLDSLLTDNNKQDETNTIEEEPGAEEEEVTDGDAENETDDPKVVLLMSQLSIKNREMVTLQNMQESLKSEEESVEYALSTLPVDLELSELNTYKTDLQKSQAITKERMELCSKDIARKQSQLQARGVNIDISESYVLEDGLLVLKIKQLVDEIIVREKQNFKHDIQKYESKLKKSRSYTKLANEAFIVELGNKCYVLIAY